MPVGGGFRDPCPLGKQAQAEGIRAFGFQSCQAQTQEFFAQAAVVVGVGRFQREPPEYDYVTLDSVFIL